VKFKEHPIVRVTKLLSDQRAYTGTESVKRAPRVGDQGTIVHAFNKSGPYVVECVNSDGLTLWLADFAQEELEIIT
jgi:hypothetical protein